MEISQRDLRNKTRWTRKMLIQGKCNGTVWGRDYIVK
jgi:hypothetical protein